MKKDSKYTKDYLSKKEQSYLWVEIKRSVAHAYNGLFVYFDSEKDKRAYKNWCKKQGFQFILDVYHNYIGILWSKGENVRLIMGKRKPILKKG